MSIGFVQFQKVNASSVLAASAIAAGDLIWVATQGTAAGTPTVSDTVNAGNYNYIGSFTTLTSDIINLFWIRCNAAGTPTISCTGVAINRLAFGHYNGFINNATVLTGDIAHNTTATATTYDSTAFTTSQNIEHAFGILDGSGQNSASNSAQFNGRGGDSNLRAFDTIGGTGGPFSSGTSVDLSGTFSVASNSFAIILGFYDGPLGAVVGKPIGGVIPPMRRWIQNQYFQAAPRAAIQQTANVTLSGQTVTFSQGALSAEIDVTLGAQTVALSQGALSIFNSTWQAKQIGGLVSPILGPLSNNLFRPVLRGVAAQAGGTLSGLTINTTTGSITATPTQFVTLTGQTINFTQGTISGADAATLGSQTATFSQGSVTASVSVTLGSQTIAITQQSLAVPIALSGQTIHFSQGSVGPQAQGSSGNRRMDFNFLGFGPIP